MSSSDTNIPDSSTASAANAHSALPGILCLCGGAFVFSLQDLVIKLMSGSYALSEVLTLRGAIACLSLIVLLRFSGGFRTLRSRRLGALLFRSLLLLVAYTTYYLAMASLPLAVVVALFFAAPLFIVLLSGPMLGERVRAVQIVAALVGFCGVVVICFAPGINALVLERLGLAAPGEADAMASIVSGLRDPAAFLAVASAFFYGLAAVLARKLAATESGAVMAFFQNFTFLVGAAIIAAITNLGGDLSASISHQSLQFLLRPWTTPSTTDLLLMASTGFVGAAGSYLLTQAYRLSQASIVASFEYVSIPLAVIFGWTLWGETPLPATYAGIVLIIGAGLYVLRSQRDA